MKQLTLTELMEVRGGYECSTCKDVQAWAAELDRQGASDAEWEEWLVYYDKLCGGNAHDVEEAKKDSLNMG